MSRGENPGALLSVQTTLTYSATEPFGHASAGKDLVLSMIDDPSDSDYGKAELGADNKKILGKFVDLDKNGVASYMPSGMPLLLRKSADAIVLGEPLLCAGNGKVKSPPSTKTVASATAGRGQAIEIQETGDNGRIIALLT